MTLLKYLKQLEPMKSESNDTVTTQVILLPHMNRLHGIDICLGIWPTTPVPGLTTDTAYKL